MEPNSAQDQQARELPSASRLDAKLRRRTLLRGGAGAAAPVLMTLASGPVGATGAACTVASSFVSVATFQSRNPLIHGNSAQCSSGNVQTWRDLSLLPATGTPMRPGYLNVTVATYLGSTTSTYNTKLLWEVLSEGTAVSTTGESGVLQHILALALSIQNGYVGNSGSVSVAYLQGVWVNFKLNSDRYKLPASNIDWGSAELITWLRVLLGTMALP
jgi:hypothetical protein